MKAIKSNKRNYAAAMKDFVKIWYWHQNPVIVWNFRTLRAVDWGIVCLSSSMFLESSRFRLWYEVCKISDLTEGDTFMFKKEADNLREWTKGTLVGDKYRVPKFYIVCSIVGKYNNVLYCNYLDTITGGEILWSTMINYPAEVIKFISIKLDKKRWER